ncbi:MAG: hypothetical protein WAT79_11960 [Saprospiraceae bacterium]
MFWELLDEHEKALVLLKILTHLAKVDGQLNEKEFAYLAHVCEKLKVSIEEIRHAVLSTEELNEILPSDEQDRMMVLYHLLFMMDADKIVDEKEEKMIYHYGLKLGFSEYMVRDFIDVFKKYDLDDLPPNAMLSIIQKYQN